MRCLDVATAMLLAALLATAPGPGRAQTGAAPEADVVLDQPLTIDECVRIALENNLELRIASTNFSAARAGVDEANGSFWPQLVVTGERTNVRHWGERPEQDEHIRSGTAGITQVLPFGTTLDFSYGVVHDELFPDTEDSPMHVQHFGLTQPLLRGGGWRAGTAAVQGARFEQRISAAALHTTELSVVQQVKAAYYEVIRNAKLIEVNQKAIQRDSMLVLQSQSKLDAGLGTKRDVLSAEIIREQDRGKLVDAATAHDEALDVLARVMGLRIGRRVRIAQKDVELDPVRPDEAAWVRKALRDNPVVRGARLGLDRARLDLQVAGNARLPQLDLTLNYDRTDDPDFNELTKEENILRARLGDDPKELDFTAHQGWRALLTLTYPLGNRAPGAAHRRSRLLYEQAQRNLEDLERQVTLDIRSAIRALSNNVERLGILEKNIEGARNKLEFASINFQLGRASNLDVTEAQKDLLDAETDYINEVIDYRVQLATIESLVGGFE